VGLISLKCSACGASLEVDSRLEVGYCQYCGTKFMLSEHVNINVKIDNGNDNKIIMANEYLESGNFERAEKIYKDVLLNDINNYQAWWGRYLCETYYSKYYGYVNRYGETSISIKRDIIRKNLNFAYNAIKNAPIEIAEEYKKIIAYDEEFIKNNV